MFVVNYISKRHTFAALLGCLLVSVVTGPVSSEPGLVSHLRQVAPLRQDSVRVPGPADLPKEAPPASLAPSSRSGTRYDGRRAGRSSGCRGWIRSGRATGSFAPILSQLAPGQVDPTLPPLQRVGLTDMNLIAIIWGGYGYTAMVQTPDGNGYTVRKGTRIGPNAGVVSAVTEKALSCRSGSRTSMAENRSEYVKLLHPKEGLE